MKKMKNIFITRRIILGMVNTMKQSRWLSVAAALLLTCMAAGAMAADLAAGTAPKDNRSWTPLAKDGIHDPKSPALTQLQEPGEALSVLPGDHRAGDKILWGEALMKGMISPRSNIYPETKFTLRETEILLNKNGSAGAVRFPHKDHTLWLDCVNCHDKIFQMESGSNKYSKLAILNGEQCGVCHGAIAFPLIECKRCHIASRKSPQPVADKR